MIREARQPTANELTVDANGTNQPQVVVLESEEREAASGSPAFSHLSILHSLRRHAYLTLPIGVCLAFAGALVGWSLFVPTYTASAFLRINAHDRPLVFETADQMAGRSSFDLYKNTQQQLVVTPFVLNAALRDKKVSSLPSVAENADPIRWLQDSVEVTFPARGEIMEVTFESSSEEVSVAIVNAIVAAYLDEVVNHERNERLQRLDNLERVHADAESKVRAKQGELKALASALGTGDSASLTVAQQSALQQFGLMQEKLSVLQFELMSAQGELSIANEIRDRILSEAAEPREDSETAETALKPQVPPNILSLRRDIADLSSKLDVTLESHGRAHPTAKVLNRQLIAKKEILKQELADFEEFSENVLDRQQQERLNPDEAPVDEYSLLSLEKRVQVLGTQEKILKKKVDELEQETRTLGRSSIDVELMRSEIDALEQVLSRVSEEIERTSIELKTASRIKLVNPAERATAPSERKRIASAAGLGLFGLMAPIALGAVWDLSRRKVDDPEVVNSALELSTVGMIPLVSDRALHSPDDRLSGRAHHERRFLNESILSMASLVWQLFQTQDTRVVMISSAVAGEGKSTTSIQLAQTLARSNRSVLLVDLDLRSPSVDSYLKLDRSPGVSDILNDQVDWRETVQTVGDLHVIPSGPVDVELSQHETSGALAELFFSLRRAFDVIIIDSSPVLPVVDARLVGTYCDGAIMTMIRDVSRVPLAVSACDLLTRYGTPVLGTVFIGVPTSASYRYSRYPYYGFESEKAEQTRLPR